MTKTKRKKPGPAPTGVGRQIVVRMQPPLLRRLDGEIRRRWPNGVVSRPEAVRRLLDRAIPRT